MKYSIGSIIYFEPVLPSFKYQTGLYIIMECTQTIIKMCKIDEKGNPNKFDDDRFMVSDTSINSPYIHRTNMEYKLPVNIKYD